MSRFALCVCIVAAAACTNTNASKLDKVAAANPESGSPGAAPHAPGKAGSTEDRLSRVERRLDKVIALLEQNLPPDQPDPSTVYSVPVSASDPVEGPADAKVTIIEGFEFLCPFCYLVNPAVDKVRAQYPKDVRIVHKYLVIHGEPAVHAARIACAANKQGKYTPVKDALWNGLFRLEGDRPAMKQENVNLDAMKKLAVDAGADLARLEADLDGCKTWLQDSARTLQPLGVSGTPTFFVNGRPLQRFEPEAFDAIIKEELAKADKAIADGVPQGEYYQRQIVAKGEKRAKGRFED
jgi:protein-disulfide isomerase